MEFNEDFRREVERREFEIWAASNGYRFNEGDLQHCKTWAWAAWQARAAQSAGADTK